MRKQMDLFGLNPSHAILSSQLSFSNLHVSAEGREQSGCVCGWGRGAACNVNSTKQEKQKDRQFSEQDSSIFS